MKRNKETKNLTGRSVRMVQKQTDDFIVFMKYLVVFVAGIILGSFF